MSTHRTPGLFTLVGKHDQTFTNVAFPEGNAGQAKRVRFSSKTGGCR